MRNCSRYQYLQRVQDWEISEAETSLNYPDDYSGQDIVGFEIKAMKDEPKKLYKMLD